MADSFIPVTPSTDPSLIKMQSFENTVSGEDVHAEAVALVDSSGNAITTLPISGTVTSRIVGNTGATVDSTVAAGSAPTNAVAVLGQFTSTPPAPTDAQTVAQQVDQSGNSRITFGASIATLSVWNSSTALNSTQTIYSNTGATAATVLLQQSAGTFSAGAITYEVSYDGTNFVSIPSNAVIDPTDTAFGSISLPYTLVTSTNKAFLIVSAGWRALRIKLSTAIVGTGTVTPVYTLLPEAPARSVTLAGVGNKVDIQRIGGNTVSTVASGKQIVGIVSGNTAAVLDGLFAGNSAASTGALQVLSMRPNPTTSTTATFGSSGSYAANSDLSGNIRVIPGQDVTLGNLWNNGTALNSTQVIYLSAGPPSVGVHLVQSAGTFSAGAITFEISYDGTNWVTIPADCVLDPSSASLAAISVPYTLVTSTNKPFLIINRGWQALRMKLSTAITGTGTVSPNWHLLPHTIVSHEKPLRASTPAQSTVANSASSVTLLAANAGRLGATIFNDDTAGTGATLKVKLGATASASSFTVAMAPQSYYEVPFNYTGIIDAIASGATGNARITELTA